MTLPFEGVVKRWRARVESRANGCRDFPENQESKQAGAVVDFLILRLAPHNPHLETIVASPVKPREVSPPNRPRMADPCRKKGVLHAVDPTPASLERKWVTAVPHLSRSTRRPPKMAHP